MGIFFRDGTFGAYSGTGAQAGYNFWVARGWESKSIEDQQAQFTESKTTSNRRLTPDELAKRRVLDGLILSRKRILQQLGNSPGPNQRTILQSALTHLDSEIAKLG